MAIDIGHVLAAFQGSLHLNLRILREIYGVRSIEMMPRPDSLLAIPPGVGAPEPLRLNCDNSITPYVIQAHSWQPEEFGFVQRTMAGSSPFTLIDIGANVGLFSRQCLAHLPNCGQTFAYEPDPTNFAALEFNLSRFGNVIKRPVGLAAVPGKMPFFIDPDNSGNYSLNSAAMAGAHSVREVECVDIRAESARWTESGRPVFFKSDTQGYDETLVTALDESFWTNVSGGIIEVWRIAKPAYDREKLGRVLNVFPHKCFLNQPGHLLDTESILAFLEGVDGASHDLGFWR